MLNETYAVRGLEVPLETWGSSAQTLVFLPGLGCRPGFYRRGLERLADRFRIVAPDLSFRSHRRLPGTPEAYLDVVSRIADDLAPDAVWVGHSFGALLALLHEGPAIALAPSVPTPASLGRMFTRAARQQARQYMGREGWFGVRYAARVMTDYVRAAVARPGMLFPTLEALRAPGSAFPPQAPCAVVFLCRSDDLYRDREYEAYFGRDGGRFDLRTVEDSHDWPITNPERMARAVPEAVARLTGVRATPSAEG